MHNVMKSKTKGISPSDDVIKEFKDNSKKKKKSLFKQKNKKYDRDDEEDGGDE